MRSYFKAQTRWYVSMEMEQRRNEKKLSYLRENALVNMRSLTQMFLYKIPCPTEFLYRSRDLEIFLRNGRSRCLFLRVERNLSENLWKRKCRMLKSWDILRKWSTLKDDNGKSYELGWFTKLVSAGSVTVCRDTVFSSLCFSCWLQKNSFEGMRWFVDSTHQRLQL